MPAAFSTRLITTEEPSFCRIRLEKAEAAEKLENAESVHAPMLMGLCGLNTLSMFRNRDGTPRSLISKADESAPPPAAIQRALRASSRSSPTQLAMFAMTAEAPAAPPTKKYNGTSGFHCGSLSRGTP